MCCTQQERKGLWCLGFLAGVRQSRSCSMAVVWLLPEEPPPAPGAAGAAGASRHPSVGAVFAGQHSHSSVYIRVGKNVIKVALRHLRYSCLGNSSQPP